MMVRKGTESKVGSKENITLFAIVLLILFVGTAVLDMALTFLSVTYLDWFRVWVVIVVAVSVLLQFLGKMNLGFLLAVVATIIDVLNNMLTGRWSTYNLDLDFVYAEHLTMIGWFSLVIRGWFFFSYFILLPLASTLLVVGRAKRKS